MVKEISDFLKNELLGLEIFINWHDYHYTLELGEGKVVLLETDWPGLLYYVLTDPLSPHSQEHVTVTLILNPRKGVSYVKAEAAAANSTARWPDPDNWNLAPLDHIVEGKFLLDDCDLCERIRAPEAEKVKIIEGGLRLAAQWKLKAEKAERELQEQIEFMWLNVRSHPEGTSCIDTDRKLRETKAEVERLKAENNTLKIVILKAGLTPPGWVRLAGVERGSDEMRGPWCPSCRCIRPRAAQQAGSGPGGAYFCPVCGERCGPVRREVVE